jgi:hypothetical protein
MGGWDEEVWYWLFQAAVLTERLGEYAEKVATAYLRAFQNRPSRAELLVELAKFLAYVMSMRKRTYMRSVRAK